LAYLFLPKNSKLVVKDHAKKSHTVGMIVSV